MEREYLQREQIDFYSKGNDCVHQLLSDIKKYAHFFALGKKKPLIRSILIFFILLSPVLLPVVRSNTSDTADSVYFRVQIDTLGGIHVGRVMELMYVLVNSQFDNACYPEFNDSIIEPMSGPESYKSNSYSIVNGVESKKHEIGFRYLVRFIKDGQVKIPVASVTVGTRTYTTPECSVFVHPAKVDLNTLKCDLKVEQLAGNYAKYRATLTCNTRPDQNPPLLSINGKTARPDSKSYSNSDGNETYTYSYFFTSKGYDVACDKLTFGGIPYPVNTQKSCLDDSDFIIAFLIMAALFELIWWLAYRYRYREEKDAPLAAFVLEKKTLPLILSWAYTHYGASHTLLFFSILSFFMTGLKFYASDTFQIFFFRVGYVFLFLAYILYRNQRRKLDFQNIPTSLDKQAIYDKIYNLSVTYDWEIDHYGEDCIVAHTNPAFWHLTWGEQIFIVFDKGQVWVNSVNDLNKRTSLCSFGYNKRNIQKIKEALI